MISIGWMFLKGLNTRQRGVRVYSTRHAYSYCLPRHQLISDDCETIEYKLGVMVYQCLHGQAPRYLTDHLIPASDVAPRRRYLRSANRNCLTVPRCRLSTYGCWAFHYASPTVWNSLPDELRNSEF